MWIATIFYFGVAACHFDWTKVKPLASPVFRPARVETRLTNGTDSIVDGWQAISSNPV